MASDPSTGSSAAFGGSAVPRVAGFGSGGITADINVTPMVDVMLVLLIIFMVVTPVLAGYEAVPPEARYHVPEPDEDVVTLGIDRAGVFYLENDPVAPEELAARLRGIYRTRPGDHLLFLRADRDVGYRVVLDAVDAARAAGVQTIGAITSPEDDEGTGTEDGPPAAGGR